MIQNQQKSKNQIKNFFQNQEKPFWYFLIFTIFLGVFFGFLLYFVIRFNIHADYEIKVYELSIFFFIFGLFIFFTFFYVWKANRTIFFSDKNLLKIVQRVVNGHKGTLLVFNNFDQVFWTNNKTFFSLYFKYKKNDLSIPLKNIFRAEVVKKIKETAFFELLPITIFNAKKNRKEEFFLSKINTNFLLLHYNSHFLLKNFIQEENLVFFLLEIQFDLNSIKDSRLFPKYESQALVYAKFWLSDFFNNKGFWTIQVKKNVFLILINFWQLKLLKANNFAFIKKLIAHIQKKKKIKIDIKGGVSCHQNLTFDNKQSYQFYSNNFWKSYQNALGMLDKVDYNASSVIAVMNNDKKINFYGPKAHLTAVDNDSDFYLKKKQEFLEKIQKYSQIVILGHKNTDFDAFASGIALKLFLENKFNHKKIFFVATDVDDKTKKTANKILDFKYEKYVTSDFNFLLFSSLKATDTAWVLVDTNDFKMADLPKDIATNNSFFIIDHHIESHKNPFKPIFKVINNEVSSTAELMFNLFEWQKEYSFIPDFLFLFLTIGILMDTNNLQINLSKKTLSVINFLTEKKGIDLEKVINDVKNFKFQFIAEKTETIALSAKKIILKVFYSKNIDNKMASTLADDFIDKQGVDVVFVVLYNPEKTVFVSARSRTSFDVQKICQPLGGGGDKKRAAAKIEEIDVDTLIKKIKKLVSSRWSVW